MQIDKENTYMSRGHDNTKYNMILTSNQVRENTFVW
jgi:hypothetical protein